MKPQTKSDSTITLKGIIDEDFVNYRVPSMVLMFPYCTFKCGSEYCQNSNLAKAESITVGIKSICERYANNSITEAVVCQGLEPIDSFAELILFISKLRCMGIDDDVVIYTGYTKEELTEKQYLEPLKEFGNIVIKYGRYLPNNKPHYDDILGVNLASDNQYAERLIN